MAISANTTRPVQFLRRLSGKMEPPVYPFPVGQTSTTWRKGDGVFIPATPDGKVDKATGAAATGIAISEVDGTGLLGFFYGPKFPPSPTSAGVQGTYTSPASLTTDDPIPEDEKINVVLALGDCVFMAHETNGATDITAPIRNPSAAATGGVLVRHGLWVGTPTGETERVMVDASTRTTGNLLAYILDWAHPQLPLARGTAPGAADLFAVKLGASGTTNPAVEFMVRGGALTPTV